MSSTTNLRSSTTMPPVFSLEPNELQTNFIPVYLEGFEAAFHTLADCAYDDNPSAQIKLTIKDANGRDSDVVATLDVGAKLPPHLRLHLFEHNRQHYAVFASRGTHAREDYGTDVELANINGKTPPRFESSWKSIENIVTTLKRDGFEVLFTGHSLGAAEAQYLAVRFGTRSLTFDNPGCRRIIENSLRNFPVIDQDHLTYNNAPNIINSGVPLFTGGPIGRVLHGNYEGYKWLDALLIVLTLLMLVLLFTAENSGMMITILFIIMALIFSCIVHFTYENHTLGNRSRIAYYTENAPFCGHIVCAFGLLFLGGVWTIAQVVSFVSSFFGTGGASKKKE